MSKLKIHKVQRRNPQKPNEPLKWHPVLENVGTLSGDELMQLLVKRNSLTKGTLVAVFCALAEILPDWLLLGLSVEVPFLGHFRLSIQSEGADTEEECTVKNIKKLNINFLPSGDLKKRIK